MKKIRILSACMFFFTSTLTSCFVNRFDVGKGAQSGAEVRKTNTYFVAGLIPGKVSNPAQMAGGATDYNVTIVHTFFNGFIGVVTAGIYTPTTTIVKR